MLTEICILSINRKLYHNFSIILIILKKYNFYIFKFYEICVLFNQ